MTISTTLTFNRHSLGMFALLALASVSLVENRALASCGDYLMPLHQKEVVEIGDLVASGSNALIRSGNRGSFSIPLGPHQKVPCHGPGCNQSQEPFTLTILPPERGPQTFGESLESEPAWLGDERKPSISPWPSSERCCSCSVLDILRPPRTC